MTIVVDASVAAKWLLKEEHSLQANALRSEDALIAPALIAAELGNVLWKAYRRGTVSRADALTALQLGLCAFGELVATETLDAQALTLALDLNHSVYDCFYLALAQRESAPLATADVAMIAAARKAKIKVRRI